MNCDIDECIVAVYLKNHPVLSEHEAYKAKYVAALDYFADTYKLKDNASGSLLKRFSDVLLGDKNNNSQLAFSEQNNRKQKFKWQDLFGYLYTFAADCFLMFAGFDEKKAKSVLVGLKRTFKPRYSSGISALFEALYHGAILAPPRHNTVKGILRRWRATEKHYRELIEFQSDQPERFLVTATMSAGKSTMINAIIGETLARTSQEACTADLHFYLNKLFDDKTITVDKDNVISVYFRAFVPFNKRVCIIDSPGVNSAINQSHKRVTQKALKEANYDKLVYLFHAAGGLGREEDALYLKYISQIVPKNKTIFVVNKLDAFRKSEDSIPESLDGVRKDLEKLGYDNPIICPLSAYFGFLIKKKLKGVELDEDEQDEFDRYVRKFKKPEYDLSSYYPPPGVHKNDILTEMSIRCGLYGLEKILAGA